jgi:outer membrane protein assembly factor BamB
VPSPASCGNDVYSSPAVANGLVYIGSNNKYVYAVDAVTGEQV